MKTKYKFKRIRCFLFYNNFPSTPSNTSALNNILREMTWNSITSRQFICVHYSSTILYIFFKNVWVFSPASYKSNVCPLENFLNRAMYE